MITPLERIVYNITLESLYDVLATTKHNAGIYAIHSKDVVLYVGRSSDIFRRVHEHAYFFSGIIKDDRADGISVEYYDSGYDLSGMEKMYIGETQPKYNTVNKYAPAKQKQINIDDDAHKRLSKLAIDLNVSKREIMREALQTIFVKHEMNNG